MVRPVFRSELFLTELQLEKESLNSLNSDCQQLSTKRTITSHINSLNK
jgi:hypothetical protein